MSAAPNLAMLLRDLKMTFTHIVVVLNYRGSTTTPHLSAGLPVGSSLRSSPCKSQFSTLVLFLDGHVSSLFLLGIEALRRFGIPMTLLRWPNVAGTFAAA